VERSSDRINGRRIARKNTPTNCEGMAVSDVFRKFALGFLFLKWSLVALRHPPAESWRPFLSERLPIF